MDPYKAEVFRVCGMALFTSSMTGCLSLLGSTIISERSLWIWKTFEEDKCLEELRGLIKTAWPKRYERLEVAIKEAFPKPLNAPDASAIVKTAYGIVVQQRWCEFLPPAAVRTPPMKMFVSS